MMSCRLLCELVNVVSCRKAHFDLRVTRVGLLVSVYLLVSKAESKPVIIYRCLFGHQSSGQQGLEKCEAWLATHNLVISPRAQEVRSRVLRLTLGDPELARGHECHTFAAAGRYQALRFMLITLCSSQRVCSLRCDSVSSRCRTLRPTPQSERPLCGELLLDKCIVGTICTGVRFFLPYLEQSACQHPVH